MVAQDLVNILNNKIEIPSLKSAELYFQFKNSCGEEIALKLKKVNAINAFGFSRDIIFKFSEDS